MARQLWMAAGVFFVAVGWIGVVLPILPTVPFLLLALFCFARGKPEWEQRLLNHPHYGPPLREWRERRAISRKAKLAAFTAMAAGAALAVALIGFPWAWVSITILAVVAAWIATRPE